MHRSLSSFIGALGGATVIASIALAPVAGQSPAAPAPARGARPATPAPGGTTGTTAASRPAAKPYTAPRTADGHVDLQGVYDTSTITPMERPAGVAATTSEADAKRQEQGVVTRRDRAGRPSDGDRQAPPVGGDGSTGASGNVGGYNNFWIDSGDTVVTINGERRTSIVVDPPDGRIPRRAAGAGAARGAGAGRGAPAGGRGAAAQAGAGRGAAPAAAPAVALAPTSDAAENAAPIGRGAYDNPEQRPLSERCLLGFGSTSGPPALPVLYNNFKQIVQTPDYVMILAEMDHDARIVRMNQPHRPESVRMWLGDPVGKWEGDTLVVDTTNFTEKTRYGGSSQNLHIVERFSRLDDRTLLYRFTVDDPSPNSPWARPWTGEYTWRLPSPEDHLYEYACHEGNYAFGDIMRGERLLEKEAEEAAKSR